MKFRLALILLVTTLFLSSCNFTLASDITPPPDYKSPTPAPTIGPLFPANPPAPQDGAAIYAEKCAPCHGDQGRGDGPQGMQLSVKVPAYGLPEVGRGAVPANYFSIVSQGKIENFMPPFSGSLNEQQRWDVVAYALSLHTSTDEINQGKALYEANCTKCHGADGSTIAKVNLADQQFMAKRSEQDLFNAVTSGVPTTMPAFSQLTENERWAISAYVRSLTFAHAQATAIPQPSPTEAATATPAAATLEGTTTVVATVEGTTTVVATVEGTPQPVPAATAMSTVAPNTTGTITGSVTEAAGGTLPAGLTVKLIGFDQDPNSSTTPKQVLSLDGNIQPDGTFTFENVAIPESRVFMAEVNYQGVPYKSDVSAIEKNATGLALTPVKLYETTDDLTNLEVKQGHLIIQFDTSRIGILEFLAISNPSSKTVVFKSDGTTLPFAPLPQGVESLGFDLTQGDAQFIQTDTGFAVPPTDKLYAAVTGFAMPYDKSVDITVPLGIAIPALNVIAPVGVTVKGDQLTGQPPDSQSQNQIFTGGPFNTGDQVSFTVSGKPDTGSAPVTSTQDNTGLLVGIGALGLALIGVGAFFFLRGRNQTREQDDDQDEPSAGETADAIMDAIIALDDQYRAGNISEEAYQKRRAELKSQLKDKL
jgi:mono/diheme cytochrome c family protein